MSKWTIDNIPDISNQVIIITGANTGLGFEAAKVLASKKATIVLACRSIEKGQKAIDEIKKENPEANLDVIKLDLMDLESISKFATEFKSKYQKLNVLINNAGIMMPPYSKTKDGFESQMGTNHFGHFALTGQLLDIIKKTPESRVVTLSSLAQKQGDMDWKNLHYENGKGYKPTKAYGRSKLANLLFAYELERFFKKNNINAISLAAHPGISDTDLARHLEGKFLFKILFPIFKLISHSAYDGALPEVRAAVDPKAKGGQYYGPSGWKEMKGDPIVVHSNEKSKDKELAKKLWAVSEKLTKVKFQ